MHRKLVGLFIILVLSAGGFSHPLVYGSKRLKSCLPNFTSANHFVNLQNNKRYSIPLESVSSGERFLTEVEIEVFYSEESLVLNAEYEAPSDWISNPFSLDMVMILKDGNVIKTFDFTHGCLSVGASLFPGDFLNIGKIKNVSPGELNIIVWGRL